MQALLLLLLVLSTKRQRSYSCKMALNMTLPSTSTRGATRQGRKASVVVPAHSSVAQTRVVPFKVACECLVSLVLRCWHQHRGFQA
jgi:hypothetical protein